MTITPTGIADLLLLEPTVWGDERGYFFESFSAATLAEHGITNKFIQDNEAFSRRGVLRGLHYQTEPYAQAKLVRVVQGEVLDVAVDIRPASATYGKWYSVRLSGENKRQLLVPRGFAHGYVVLSETAIFCYKVDNVYAKTHEGGIAYNDPALGINWVLPDHELILSDKDTILPNLL